MVETNLVMLVLLGGLLGCVGQGLRVIVGLKKINEQAGEQTKAFRDIFDGRVLLISLLIGFVAGALAIIALDATTDTAARRAGETLRGYLMPVMAAGYAGTDFIEGFVKKYLPKV